MRTYLNLTTLLDLRVSSTLSDTRAQGLVSGIQGVRQFGDGGKQCSQQLVPAACPAACSCFCSLSATSNESCLHIVRLQKFPLDELVEACLEHVYRVLRPTSSFTSQSRRRSVRGMNVPLRLRGGFQHLSLECLEFLHHGFFTGSTIYSASKPSLRQFSRNGDDDKSSILSPVM